VSPCTEERAGCAAMNGAPRSGAAIIAAYLDAVTRKDASAIDRYFAPDVEYIVNGAPLPNTEGSLPPLSAECRAVLPWLGLYRGRDAVRDFFDRMHRNLEVTRFGPREVIVEGDKGAAFGWFRLHALPTMRTVDIAYSIFFELRDGLIVKYHFLENTFDVARAFHTAGAWSICTDGVEHRVPLESEGRAYVGFL
jgi:ketosteroid isomerase-like protein